MSSWLNKTLVNKKRWKRSRCVLKGNIFYYHSDQAEKNLKGTIVLQGLLSINQIQKPTLFRKRSLVFSITDSNRTVYFQADTEQEWSSWCTILRTFDPRHSMPEPTTRYGLLGPTPSKLNQSNDTSYGIMPSHIENTEATRRNASVTSYGALPPIPPQKKTSATNAYGSLPNATPALEEGTTRSGGIDPGYGTLPILNEISNILQQLKVLILTMGHFLWQIRMFKLLILNMEHFLSQIRMFKLLILNMEHFLSQIRMFKLLILTMELFLFQIKMFKLLVLSMEIFLFIIILQVHLLLPDLPPRAARIQNLKLIQ